MQSLSLQHTIVIVILIATVLCTISSATPFPDPQNSMASTVDSPKDDNSTASSPQETPSQTPPQHEHEAHHHATNATHHHKTRVSETKAINHDVAIVDDIVKRLAQDGLSSQEIIRLAHNGTSTEIKEAKHRHYLAYHPFEESKRAESLDALKKIAPIIDQINANFNATAATPSDVKPHLAEINRLRTEGRPYAMTIIANAASNMTRASNTTRS
ncbi:secreted protein [Melampsora americana]|nr:secreted protein [Melampsora americana]